MILTTLSSSSKGNIHVLDNGITTIILDCGIKYGRLVKELNSLTISGVLITHEHKDHCAGCTDLALNKKTPFYGTEETLEKINIPTFLKYEIEPLKQFKIVSFNVIAFKVNHDAAHPVNYLIHDELSGAQLLYITDTGSIDNLEFKDIDYILIECNFDEKWFDKDELTTTETIKKKRLFGPNGHLSVQQTIEFLKRTVNHNTKKIILCHISHSFEEYKVFEYMVKKELNFENVVALNPKYIGPIINELREEKEVLPFE